MSRVLFTWELGSNLGHLWRHIPIARLLKQRGHEVLFAFRERDRFSDVMLQEGFRTVQAPFYFDNETAARELLHYVDILAANGFNDAGQLSGLLDSWSTIFQEFRPDIVAAQFAPSSLLSAHLNHITAVQIDCGFGCPPDESPYPCFRPWLNVAREELLAKEQLLVNRINNICLERGAEEFTSLQDVFKTPADLLLTAPELDHYTGRRNGNYVGPIFNIDEGEDFEWSENNVPRIFVYLRPFEGLPNIFKSLSACGCNVIAALPGISEEFSSVFSSPNLKISSAPVRLANLLSKADIAITHGGHGLASACLLAGVPMLLIPQMAEQLMTVYNYERLGIGKGVKHDEVATRFEPALRRMLKDSSYRENAGRLAQKYAGYDQVEVIQRLCDVIEEKANGRL
jgi:UDP:flavonoid glycosyltransferase YjiC (YdhE family)